MIKKLIYNQFFNNFLNYLNNKKVSQIYFWYLIILIVTTIFYGFAITDRHPQYINGDYGMNFSSLGWENDLIVLNLINNGEFKFNLYNIDFYTAKYPLLPYTIYFLSRLSENFFLILILKNIFFFSILFWSVYFFSKTDDYKNKILNSIVLLFLLHFNPYNFHVMSNFYFEDFANSLILPALFLVVVSKINYLKRNLCIGIFLSLLFLSKSSMTIFCIFFSLFFAFNERKNKYYYIPLLFVILSSLFWSGYAFKKTGFYPVLNNNSSFNNAQLALALQDDFHKIYPHYTIDTIFNTNEIVKNKNKYGFYKLKNEWEFNELFKERNRQYLNKNLKRYIKDMFIKINFVFFYPYQDANGPNIPIHEKKIKPSMIINKIFLNMAILLVISMMYVKFKKKLNINNELYFFSILVFIIPIFLIGWATSKHLVGICGVSIIYIYNQYKDFIKS